MSFKAAVCERNSCFWKISAHSYVVHIFYHNYVNLNLSYYFYDAIVLFYLFLDASRAGDKYETSSTNHGYSKHMKLKIRSVGPNDFGSYRCVAKNSLGETDGLIKLDGEFIFVLKFEIILPINKFWTTYQTFFVCLQGLSYFVFNYLIQFNRYNSVLITKYLSYFTPFYLFIQALNGKFTRDCSTFLDSGNFL